VTYRQGDWTMAIEADYCVATLPPHVLARIESNLAAPVRSVLATFAPIAAGKIGLEYRSRWWENDLRIYGGITETDLDVRNIWYPSHDFHAERGLVVGYYTVGDAAEAYGRLTPADRAERAVAQGVKIHGEKYRTELASSFSVAWHRMPHLEGAWTAPPWGSPGYNRLLEPDGRVYFAGDWLSREVAWQHGAFVAARAAVTALHQRVMAG
jgi:monoamine oxidase